MWNGDYQSSQGDAASQSSSVPLWGRSIWERVCRYLLAEEVGKLLAATEDHRLDFLLSDREVRWRFVEGFFLLCEDLELKGEQYEGMNKQSATKKLEVLLTADWRRKLRPPCGNGGKVSAVGKEGDAAGRGLHIRARYWCRLDPLRLYCIALLWRAVESLQVALPADGGEMSPLLWWGVRTLIETNCECLREVRIWGRMTRSIPSCFFNYRIDRKYLSVKARDLADPLAASIAFPLLESFRCEDLLFYTVLLSYLGSFAHGKPPLAHSPTFNSEPSFPLREVSMPSLKVLEITDRRSSFPKLFFSECQEEPFHQMLFATGDLLESCTSSLEKCCFHVSDWVVTEAVPEELLPHCSSEEPQRCHSGCSDISRGVSTVASRSFPLEKKDSSPPRRYLPGLQYFLRQLFSPMFVRLSTVGVNQMWQVAGMLRLGQLQQSPSREVRKLESCLSFSESLTILKLLSLPTGIRELVVRSPCWLESPPWLVLDPAAHLGYFLDAIPENCALTCECLELRTPHQAVSQELLQKMAPSLVHLSIAFSPTHSVALHVLSELMFVGKCSSSSSPGCSPRHDNVAGAAESSEGEMILALFHFANLERLQLLNFNPGIHRLFDGLLYFGSSRIEVVYGSSHSFWQHRRELFNASEFRKVFLFLEKIPSFCFVMHGFVAFWDEMLYAIFSGALDRLGSEDCKKKVCGLQVMYLRTLHTIGNIQRLGRSSGNQRDFDWWGPEEEDWQNRKTRHGRLLCHREDVAPPPGVFVQRLRTVLSLGFRRSFDSTIFDGFSAPCAPRPILKSSGQSFRYASRRGVSFAPDERSGKLAKEWGGVLREMLCLTRARVDHTIFPDPRRPPRPTAASTVLRQFGELPARLTVRKDCLVKKSTGKLRSAQSDGILPVPDEDYLKRGPAVGQGSSCRILARKEGDVTGFLQFQLDHEEEEVENNGDADNAPEDLRFVGGAQTFSTVTTLELGNDVLRRLQDASLLRSVVQNLSSLKTVGLQVELKDAQEHVPTGRKDEAPDWREMEVSVSQLPLLLHDRDSTAVVPIVDWLVSCQSFELTPSSRRWAISNCSSCGEYRWQSSQPVQQPFDGRDEDCGLCTDNPFHWVTFHRALLHHLEPQVVTRPASSEAGGGGGNSPTGFISPNGGGYESAHAECERNRRKESAPVSRKSATTTSSITSLRSTTQAPMVFLGNSEVIESERNNPAENVPVGRRKLLRRKVPSSSCSFGRAKWLQESTGGVISSPFNGWFRQSFPLGG